MSKRKRHPNHGLVKLHRTYTVEEIARLFGIHKNTVRRWLKEGLPTTDTKRPYLILGEELRAYIVKRRNQNKRPCKPGEIYCVRCRAPKAPAGGMVEYLPATATGGNLGAICPDCSAMMYRRISLAKLDAVRASLNITISEAVLRIGETSQPTVNGNFDQ